MKLSTRTRVVKSNVVEVSFPRLVENQREEFQFLGKHISVVRDRTDDEVITERKAPGAIHPEEQMMAKSLIKDWETEISIPLKKAKEQAEEIIAKAQEEAQQIHKQARLDTEALKAQVREEVSRQAYQDGFTEGKAQGYTEGKEQGVVESNEMRARAHKLLELAQRAVQDEYSRVDSSLVHLAIKISERIIHSSLDRHPELILQRIRALTLLPEERKGWILHVSPEDAVWLQNLPPREQLDIPLFSDESLNPGDCALECKEGIFDARLKEQLDRFEKLLGEELKHDRLEQAGR